MRKVSIAFLALTMIFAMTSCKKTCEHDYKSSVTREATCARKGEKTFICRECGDTYTESIPKNDNHVYTSEVTKEATVTETGVKTYTCTLCGHSYTETIAKIQSHWTKINDTDQFGDETEEYTVVGVFDDIDNEYQLLIFYDTNAFMIFDGDYQTGTPVTFSKAPYVYLETKDSAGKVRQYDLKVAGDCFLFADDDSLKNSIRNNEEMSIAVSAYYNDSLHSYAFKVNNIGLAEYL